MGYALAALGLTVLVAMTLIRAMARSARTAAEPAALFDLKVWRGQLAGIERDLERGVLAPDEAARTRVEISRRILEADRALAASGQRGGTAGPAALWTATGATALILAASFGLYAWLGAPGYPDMPIATRLARADEILRNRIPQGEAELRAPAAAPATPTPEEAELMERLRKAVAARPGDLQGHELLARNEAALGNFAASARAQAVVINLKGTAATAADYLALADAQVMAAGGYVSPEAEAALKAVLERDPGDPTARFYLGLMYAQNLRPDLAFGLWRPLAEEGPQGAPWMALVREQIEGLALAAGIPYTAPAPAMAAPDATRPDAAAMAAAAEMPPEDRQAMILGMVDRLDRRLATEGGKEADWVRLIEALGQLGDRDRATAALGRARAALADDAGGLAALDAAARRAGLIE